MWDFVRNLTLRTALMVLAVGFLSPTVLVAQEEFVRGDANGDGVLNLADPLEVLVYLFDDGSGECLDALDGDDSGSINLADPVYLLRFLFESGPVPSAPYPVCGIDPTTDSLSCETIRVCPLESFVYSNATPVYYVGLSIPPNAPQLEGGPPTIFEVTPALPSGLAIDAASGVITGIPQEAQSPTDYVVTASNSSGGISTLLTIEIKLDPLAPNLALAGPPLHRTRYSHTATVLQDGRVLIVAGTDERHLTSMSSGEVYDPTLQPDPGPEGLGGFVDTDTEGNPIDLVDGGRIFHSATLLIDGRVLIAGGAFDALTSQALGSAELFDPVTRKFQLTTNPMQNARFRHTATRVADGSILFAGGQLSLTETIIDPNFPPGSPMYNVDVEVFPSTNTLEVYLPPTDQFVVATDQNGDELTLASPFGRTGHSAMTLAGSDSELGTPDDVLLLNGGYETLQEELAPQFKFPGQLDTAKLTVPEYIDLQSSHVALAAGVLVLPRANGGALLNIGAFGDLTPDGFSGVSNIAFATNGDDDRMGGGCHNSIEQSELIVCTFTGFGPANGIQLSLYASNTMLQNHETQVALQADPPCVFGRTEAPAVLVRVERLFDGVIGERSCVFTTGGHYLLTGIGCIEVNSTWCLNDLQGFQFFDPFYDANQDPPTGTSALQTNRSPDNPTGALGTWLNADSEIADGSLDGFGEGSTLSDLNAQRIFHTLSVIPGPDQALGTIDDRVLVVGGGVDFFPEFGGEPVDVGSEVYATPKAP